MDDQNSTLPSSVDAARNAGAPKYFTGKPCKHGHLSPRYTATRTCVECGNASAAKSKAANRERYLANEAKYRRKNREACRLRCARYYSENKVKLSAKPRDNLKRKKQDADYAKRNRARLNAHNARYRAAKIMATPAWADLSAMAVEYKLAAWCTKVMVEPYHVDHIVPLLSKKVCGLHVPANLRVILGKENISKNNRTWPDMPT